MSKTAIIIGAGPAGLTAAYELVTKTDIKPIIIEQTNDIGGICKTVVHNGNRMDIGPHALESKSEIVLKWWQEILSIQGFNFQDDIFIDIKGNKVKLPSNGPNPENTDKVMLIINKVTRIFFLGKFFDYPITLNIKTVSNLGIIRIIKIFSTYIWIKIFPVKKVNSLEDCYISRFGKELYKTFFKDYTEKLWGVPCTQIAASWGPQRVEESNVTRVLVRAIKSILKRKKSIEKKNIHTIYRINYFLYPKLGIGQIWETVARIIEEKGGVIIKNTKVVELNIEDNKVKELKYFNHSTNLSSVIIGDYIFSTMPIKELIAAIGDKAPSNVKSISEGLQYRDIITVDLLLNKLKIKNETKNSTLYGLIPDFEIYIQEKGLKVGRLQIFNNWSPYMVADSKKVLLGVEYFCNEGDELDKMANTELIKFAINELQSIDIIDKNDVIDSTSIRMPKSYPLFSGTYSQFDVIREFTDKIENLFLIGRNGMHKYINMDLSMQVAITAVNNIISGIRTKDNIWNINNEY